MQLQPPTLHQYWRQLILMNQRLSSRPQSHHIVRVSLCCQSFVEPSCKVSSCKSKTYVTMHSILACTYLQDLQAYLLVQFSLHQSMYPFMHPVQPLSPTLHQWWVSRTPWPSSLQQGHHIISVSVNSAFDHWIFHCFSWTTLCSNNIALEYHLL